jgi:hypothetical protein
MNASRPDSYPADLRLQVRHAARLSHALARLVDTVDPADPSFVWLLGRADEVRAVVGSAMREWQDGRIDQRRAAERIRAYARDLEESVQAFYAPQLRPVGPAAHVRPKNDTLVDA